MLRNVFKNTQRCCNVSEICLKNMLKNLFQMFQKFVPNVLKLWSEMFEMCKIIKIAFKTQVFRNKNWGGGSLSHTLKTPGVDAK